MGREVFKVSGESRVWRRNHSTLLRSPRGAIEAKRVMLDIRIRTVPSLAKGATWLGLQLQQKCRRRLLPAE